ncbi:hypothetical protein, partial [Loigolactobacillus jiayinensis]|uniref:hypothetical protein n=1 Tax=Loigolactobacillus jiayinensis TaxID=2486016 RepID=UPI001CDCE704
NGVASGPDVSIVLNGGLCHLELCVAGEIHFSVRFCVYLGKISSPTRHSFRPLATEWKLTSSTYSQTSKKCVPVEFNTGTHFGLNFAKIAML